jgi:predicted lipoprotein with Yx(FWY)xxD motif
MLAAAPASAGVSTIGATAPDTSTPGPPPYYYPEYHPPAALCNADQDLVQATANYAVPANGTEITGWRTNATSGAGQMMTFKVFRKVGEPATYEVIGHDGPHLLTQGSSSGGSINSFTGMHIAVMPGDLIGLHTDNASTVVDACRFPAAGPYLFSNSDLADAGSAAFTSAAGYSLNVSATVQIDSGSGGPAQHTLGVAMAGAGHGSVQSAPAGIEACTSNCSHSFEEGTHVTLTATPDSYSTFGGWSGACSGTGTCELTIGTDMTVTATFNAGAYTYPPGTYGYGPYETGGGGPAGTAGPTGPVQVKCTKRKGQRKATCKKTKLVAKQAKNATLGKRVLTAPNGHTLYSLGGEHGQTFLCTESCLTFWPPLKAPPTGVLPAGPVKLGAVNRPDGAGRQVTYHGHPLYVFGGDSRPGDVHGQGLHTAGGTWGAVVLPVAQR